MGDRVEHSENRLIEVELRDLDVLLRKKFGDEFVVDSFTTNDLVPLGENYGSTMLKVDAVVRREGPKSEPEELFLVAKMTPPTEFQKEMFDSPFTFPKEIYMFEKIVPAYRALERECGIPEEEVFDPLPELYGARLSLNDRAEFDHDAVILMENLKKKNYYCESRKTGVNLGHAKLVVETLARFHALGVAVKLEKPDLFNEFKRHAKPMVFNEDTSEKMKAVLMRDLASIPDIAPHMDRLANLINRPNMEYWTKPPVEPWGSIAHTDLWMNNIMFRDGENGDVEDVKFIDYQNYLYLNPLRDLVFFLISSCTKETHELHAKDLVTLYYENFTSHLARLGCDVSLFTRKSFDEQYADAANLEFVHCVFMTKVLLAEFESPADPTVTPSVDAKSLFDARPSLESEKRMAEIALMFIEENWV